MPLQLPPFDCGGDRAASSGDDFAPCHRDPSLAQVGVQLGDYGRGDSKVILCPKPAARDVGSLGAVAASGRQQENANGEAKR